MVYKVLSLDISASSTGWSFLDLQSNENLMWGLIKTKSSMEEAERLYEFKKSLCKLFEELEPTHVVIEDVFSGLNPVVLKLLAKFSGVAIESCYEILSVIPYVMNTNTVKAYFKAKTKEILFYFIVDILEWRDASFKKDNDLTDSIAQLIAFYGIVLKVDRYREEKDYGFKFKV